MIKDLDLILASRSPRRQQILRDARINFLVKVKETEEDYHPSMDPFDVPVFLAEKKAEAFRSEIVNKTVLTADTVVLLKSKILEKPKDEEDAVRMLRELSGNIHQVVTGVCILSKDRTISFSDTTDVYFKELSEKDIRFYVKEYQPLDKAGAYGIQEWIGMVGIEKIVGSYYNVMGLPVHRVVEELEGF